jgi:hypothetical protein
MSALNAYRALWEIITDRCLSPRGTEDRALCTEGERHGPYVQPLRSSPSVDQVPPWRGVPCQIFCTDHLFQPREDQARIGPTACPVRSRVGTNEAF